MFGDAPCGFLIKIKMYAMAQERLGNIVCPRMEAENVTVYLTIINKWHFMNTNTTITHTHTHRRALMKMSSRCICAKCIYYLETFE